MEFLGPYDISSEESIWEELEPGSEDPTTYSHQRPPGYWSSTGNLDYGANADPSTQVRAGYESLTGLEIGGASVTDFREDVGSLYLSDLLHDLSGGDLGYLDIIAGSTRPNLMDQYGSYLYDIDFLQDQGGVDYQSGFNIAYGEEDSLYSDYLDEWFDFDLATGRFKAKYNTAELEQLERDVYYEGKDELSEQIDQYALSKVSDATRSVSANTLTLDDLTRFSNSRLDKLSRNLEVAKGESRGAWYDDMKADVYTMVSNMDISDIGNYEERYKMDEDAPTGEELYNLGLREYEDPGGEYDEDYSEWAEGL